MEMKSVGHAGVCCLLCNHPCSDYHADAVLCHNPHTRTATAIHSNYPIALQLVDFMAKRHSD